MLGFQEMVDKCEEQIRDLKRYLNGGVFHPSDYSIFGTQDHPQKPSVVAELRETFRALPLSEFLARSGTAAVGATNAIYMIPDKLHSDLIFYSKDTDKVPVISAYVAERWVGGDVKVPVVNDASYKAKRYSSGGGMAVETPELMVPVPTLSMLDFSIPFPIGNDLIEDAQWDLVEVLTRMAAKAVGEFGTTLALDVLRTATDGWGDVNGGASGDIAESKWMGAATTGISEAIDENGDDNWISNTIITSTEPWTHSISETLPVGSTYLPRKPGFTFCVNEMDVLLHTHAADLTDTNSLLQTIVLDRNNALLTGRKRWMEIRNYANPVEDLAGAIISCRQDSVTLYDDAICVITETAPE